MFEHVKYVKNFNDSYLLIMFQKFKIVEFSKIRSWIGYIVENI